MCTVELADTAPDDTVLARGVADCRVPTLNSVEG